MANFDKPFADKGDKTVISLDDLGIEGRISWERGFTSKYEKKPEEDGFYILRTDVNSILNLITKDIIDIRQNINLNNFDNGLLAKEGYSSGARVSIFYNPLDGTLGSSPDEFDENGKIFATRIQVISQKNNNKDSPLIRANLFKSWVVDDGRHFFELITFPIQAHQSSFAVPPGYLDFGNPKDENGDFIKYNLEDYPRVKYAIENNKTKIFKKQSGDEDKFYIDDYRGLFPRIFSNGHETIDKNREFYNVQQDGMKRMSAEIYICPYDYQGNDTITPYEERAHNLSAWIVKSRSGAPSPFKIARESTRGANERTGSSTYSYGIDAGYSLQSEMKQYYGNKLIFDTNEVTGNCNEFRPRNFNVKMYIKV